MPYSKNNPCANNYFRLDADFFITDVSWSVSQDSVPAWTSDTTGTTNGWTWSIWTSKKLG